MLKKGNPSALLWGMQTGAATMEKQYGTSSENKKWNCLLTWQFQLLGLYSKNPETQIQKFLHG